ncbi:MAG: hypothetical protein KBT48_05905 [Firmicutes bacterium]|nr:hypothetical protein [Bacillota bacterium]
MKKISTILCMALCSTMAMGSASYNPTSMKVTSTERIVSKKEATIKKTVIYNSNGIKITAKSLDNGWLGTDLKLLIENNSGDSIIVQARNSSVNGYMIETMMSEEVTNGKKANTDLTFSKTEMEKSGIKEIANLEFSLVIINPDSFDNIAETDMIKINTSLAKGFKQKYDDSGKVLLDQDGIKIVSKGIENDSILGPGILLYMENNTDHDIIIQTRDVSINGFMVDAMFSEDITSGKKSVSSITFLSSDLEDNDIKKIKNAELSFAIINPDNFQNYFESSAISIKF